MSDDLQLDLRRQEMEAFDRLPKTLRRAIDQAEYKFMSTVYYKEWQDGRPCRDLVKDVKHLSANEVARRDDSKAAGDIPQDLA